MNAVFGSLVVELCVWNDFVEFAGSFAEGLEVACGDTGILGSRLESPRCPSVVPAGAPGEKDLELCQNFANISNSLKVLKEFKLA